MRREENIGHIVGDKRAITTYHYHGKYLLSVTVIQHLSRGKKHNNKFLSPSDH